MATNKWPLWIAVGHVSTGVHSVWRQRDTTFVLHQLSEAAHSLPWESCYCSHFADKEAKVQEDKRVATLPKVKMLAPGSPSVPPAPGPSTGFRAR